MRIQPSRARAAAGLLFPGLAQALAGRLFDAFIVVTTVLGSLGIALLLLARTANDLRYYEQRPPLPLGDAGLLDAIANLPTWPPEVPVLLGLALVAHLAGALVTSGESGPAEGG